MNGAPGHLRARLKLPPLLLLLLLTLVVMMMVMWMAVSREIGGGSGRTVRTSTLLTTRGQHAPLCQASNVAIYTAFRKQVIAPRGRRDDMPPPPADGSSTRGGSTSVRGRFRSPHVSGGRPAAGSQLAAPCSEHAIA